MFILFHLLTGLVLGYLLADRLDNRAVVLPCMAGALLPDLVDKPLGIFLLGDTIGSGRFFLHNLVFLLLLLAVGAVMFWRYGRPALLAAGVGVASHQVLDLMWLDAHDWLYPFLGRGRPMDTEGWFLRELLLEISNPLEWVSGAALLVLLLPVLWPAGTRAFVARYGRVLRPAALGAVPALAALGLFFIASGVLRQVNVLTGWRYAEFNLMGGAVLLLTAYAAYRLAARLAEAAPLPGDRSAGAEPADDPSVPGPRE